MPLPFNEHAIHLARRIRRLACTQYRGLVVNFDTPEVEFDESTSDEVIREAINKLNSDRMLQREPNGWSCKE